MSNPKSMNVDAELKAVKEAFERIWPRTRENEEDWMERVLEDLEELTPEQQRLLCVLMSKVEKKLCQH
jgi:hypothetical protein